MQHLSGGFPHLAQIVLFNLFNALRDRPAGSITVSDILESSRKGTVEVEEALWYELQWFDDAKESVLRALLPLLKGEHSGAEALDLAMTGIGTGGSEVLCQLAIRSAVIQEEGSSLYRVSSLILMNAKR